MWCMADLCWESCGCLWFKTFVWPLTCRCHSRRNTYHHKVRSAQTWSVQTSVIFASFVIQNHVTAAGDYQIQVFIIDHFFCSFKCINSPVNMSERQHCNIKHLQNLICISGRGGAYASVQLAPSRPFYCKSTFPSGGGSDISIGWYSGSQLGEEPGANPAPTGLHRLPAQREGEFTVKLNQGLSGPKTIFHFCEHFPGSVLKCRHDKFAVEHVSSCSARHVTEESMACQCQRRCQLRVLRRERMNIMFKQNCFVLHLFPEIRWWK